MIQLETYKGRKSRHTCPSCGQRYEFTRFVNTETGEYLPEEVGICNRSSKCGYQYTAKQYFADHPAMEKSKNKSASNAKPKPRNYGFANPIIRTEVQKTDYIPFEHLMPTLSGYDQNAFLDFLFALFSEDTDAVWITAKRYFIGTYAHA